ncbi:chloride channel protein [Neopusillimonas aromaticivorans]|nr:chloride channel protein [Neopusillimonas aromaticivorans]WJJ93498.1 chloride channel protein [Neopusillimonas aromaticivorans]
MAARPAGKVFGGIASLSSGLVLGREGPTIHIGTSVAAAFAGRLRLGEVDHKGLLAAGAAAGLACAFNAPLAATIFVIEEMRRHFPYSFKNLTAVGLACILATVVSEAMGGSAPDLFMPVSAEPPALSVLPWFAVLGLVMGVLGVLLNRSLLFMGTVVPRFHRRAPYVFQAVVGAAAGVLLAVFPMAVTGGTPCA